MADSDDDFDDLLSAMETKAEVRSGRSSGVGTGPQNTTQQQTQSTEPPKKPEVSVATTTKRKPLAPRSPVPSTSAVRSALQTLSAEQEKQIREMEARLAEVEAQNAALQAERDSSRAQVARVQVRVRVHAHACV